MRKPTEKHLDKLIKRFKENEHLYKLFMNGISDFFREMPTGEKGGSTSVIQMVKSRIKNEDHLREKIIRKWKPDDPITEANLFERITDIAGVRVVYLAPSQFPTINNLILGQIGAGDWILNERPTVYCWDQEVKEFFLKHGFQDVQFKESHYTSVHYVVRKNPSDIPICEIQVRSILEEVWGELDHSLNYPIALSQESKREAIKILAKILRAGEKTIDLILLDK